MKKTFSVIGALFALTLVLTSCSISDDDLADPSFTTLRYEGGFGQGSKFKECVDPGTKLNTDDKFYRYPNTQREDVFDSDHFIDRDGDGNSEGSADHQDLVVNVAGVDMNVKMKVQFLLNTDCSPKTIGGKKYPGGTIQAFHEIVGKTRKAYFNSDGSYDDGWLWAMDNYITSNVVGLTTPAVRQYQPNDSWNDKVVKTVSNESAWNAIATAVEKDLAAKVNKSMDTDEQFYQNFSVTVFDVQPDGDYQQQFKDRATAQNRADTAELNKAALIAEAKTKAAVAAEDAKVKQAEIRGYGGFDNYAKLQCITSDTCGNPYQPTYKVSGTQ